jgi:hypothetical protein
MSKNCEECLEIFSLSKKYFTTLLIIFATQTYIYFNVSNCIRMLAIFIINIIPCLFWPSFSNQSHLAWYCISQYVSCTSMIEPNSDVFVKGKTCPLSSLSYIGNFAAKSDKIVCAYLSALAQATLRPPPDNLSKDNGKPQFQGVNDLISP